MKSYFMNKSSRPAFNIIAGSAPGYRDCASAPALSVSPESRRLQVRHEGVRRPSRMLTKPRTAFGVATTRLKRLTAPFGRADKGSTALTEIQVERADMN